MGRKLLEGGKVLVVSRDKEKRAELVEIIQGFGFEIMEVETLTTDEELLHTFMPQAIVFYEDNPENFRFNSVNPNSIDTPHPLPTFILVHASESIEGKKRAIVEGVDEFLLWPVSPEELAHRLNCTVRQVRNKTEHETHVSELHSALETIKGYNNELSLELAEAQECQRNLLPSKRLALNGFVINSSIRMSKQLNGDFIDIIRINPLRVVLVLMDVSGHGTDAALVTGMSHAWLHSNIHDRVSLVSLTEEFNHYLLTYTPEAMYATGFIGILDTITWDLEYVLSGHPEPLFWKNGTCFPGPMATTPPLGLYDDFKAEVTRSHIAPDNALMVYSDGLQDAFSDLDDAQNMMCDLFHQHNVGLCFRNRRCAMINNILKKGRIPEDDMSMICIKHLPDPLYIGGLKVSIPETGHYEFTLPSTEDAVTEFTRFMETHLKEEAGEDRFWDMLQVAMELLNNAMEWGNGFDPNRKILCSVNINDKEIVLSVEDQGKGFDTKPVLEHGRNIDPEQLPLDVERPGGLGIPLAIGLADQISCNKTGNRITAHFLRQQK